MRREEVDFLFLTETWQLPGTTQRLSANIVTAFETPSPLRAKQPFFEIVAVDPASIKKWMAIRYYEITFVGVYLPPSRDESSVISWLSAFKVRKSKLSSQGLGANQNPGIFREFFC